MQMLKTIQNRDLLITKLHCSQNSINFSMKILKIKISSDTIWYLTINYFPSLQQFEKGSVETRSG